MKGVTPNMKKSHEYDSPVLSRLVSIVTVFAICICSVCCIVTASKVSTISSGSAPVANNGGGSNSGGNSGNSGTGSTPGGSQAGSTPGGSQQAAPEDSTGSGGEGNASGGGASNEEILKKYTEVMDNLKANVSKYGKKEFQKLADDYNLGTAGNIVLPVAETLMTSEDKAKDQVRDDMEQIPIIDNSKGCLLTDASAIKSASMTDNGGKTTIVLVLNDEDSPEPTPENSNSPVSKTGAVFNPLSQTEIKKIVDKFAAIPGVTINQFNLTYKDCTATLVFDTETLQVESLEQIMNVYITVDAKVFLPTISGYATLVNTMRIYDVEYK